MNRRSFLNQSKVAGMAAGATLMLNIPFRAKAQDQNGAVLVVTEISNNHGHELLLTAGDILKMLNVALTNGVAEINIQGTSRHEHFITLSSENLIKLITDENLEVDSSEVVGHTHMVKITIENLS